ncbi:hypothetical protein [Bacillus sp. HMF5848]|uniref:hypothetical protein n=1 Tax=Bacillus sp. HMF5848 TaxID=2495421 RepID=UPI00163AE954|nr:hypothetical protein [Bacillus sp. HMF5848]
MAELFLMIIFLGPIYGVLIWTYFHPEESMLLGQRWQYKEEPEFSEAAIKYTKFGSIIALFIITMIFVVTVFNNYLVNLMIFLGLIIYIIFSLIKFRNSILK